MIVDCLTDNNNRTIIGGGAGGMEPTLMDSVIQQVLQGSSKLEAEGSNPVLLVSTSIRLFLSRLLRGRTSNFYILAYEEIPPSKSIRVVTTIGSQPGGNPGAAQAA